MHGTPKTNLNYVFSLRNTRNVAKDYRHSKDDWYDFEEDTSRAERKQKLKNIDQRRKHKHINREEDISPTAHRIPVRGKGDGKALS